jgi:hypothetical protein
MKKFLFMLLIIAFVCTASTVYAAQKAPLGTGNLAVKLDWIKFTDGDLKDVDVDSGFYIGLEGYGEIAQNWYLGMEAGWANPTGNVGSFDTDWTYVPIELNAKYAAAVAESVVFDLGGGISYNYGKFKMAGDGLSDWMFGGQVFMDLNFTIDQFFLGISGKYQFSQKFDKEGMEFSPNNWRLGGQIGVMF